MITNLLVIIVTPLEQIVIKNNLQFKIHALLYMHFQKID